MAKRYGIVEKVVRGELLEVQWEVEEVLDETAPASSTAEPEPEPGPSPSGPTGLRPPT